MDVEGYKPLSEIARDAASAFVRDRVSDDHLAGSVRSELAEERRVAIEHEFLNRLQTWLAQGELNAVSCWTEEPFNPKGGHVPEGEQWVLSPGDQGTAQALLAQHEPDALPVFRYLARPLEVPALLHRLPPDMMVRCRGNVAGGGEASAQHTAGGFVAELESIIQRQAAGIFTVAEAGRILEDTHPGKGVRHRIKKMWSAFDEGRLTIRDAGDLTEKLRDDHRQDFSDVVMVSDVDAWLDKSKAGYRFPLATFAEPPQVADMPTKASQAAEKEAREDARLAHCEAEGIIFDKAALLRLPDGIAKAAANLDPPIRRQSLSTDVKAALLRRFERARDGKG